MRANLGILLVPLLVVAVAGPGFLGCGECTADSRPYKACEDGYVYWRYENCSVRGELIEVCECSCNQEGSGCSDCSEWKIVQAFADGPGPEEVSWPASFLPYGDGRFLINDHLNGALKLFDQGELVRHEPGVGTAEFMRPACRRGGCPEQVFCDPDLLAPPEPQCEEGQQCISGICVTPCISGPDCEAGMKCQDGTCQPDTGGDVGDGGVVLSGSGGWTLLDRDWRNVASGGIYEGGQGLETRHDGIWVKVWGQQLVHILDSEGVAFLEPEVIDGFAFSADGKSAFRVERSSSLDRGLLLVFRAPAAEPQDQWDPWAELEFNWQVGGVWSMEGMQDGGLLLTVNTYWEGPPPAYGIQDIRFVLVRLDRDGHELFRVGFPFSAGGCCMSEPARIGDDGEIYCMVSNHTDGHGVFQLQL